MADFNTAVLLTLQHEGGYVNNSADPGGATNMGVEQRDLPNIPISTLTVTQAKEFYSEKFWNAQYSAITEQSIANKLFDLGVLFGIGTAVKIIQSVLEAQFGLTPDGVFGPATLAAINGSEPKSLLLAFQTAMVARAIQIGAARPAEQQFVGGWIRRINS
jgi:lysozyme family protein